MIGCPFDDVYKKGQVDSSNTVSCYSAAFNDQCGALGGTSFQQFCSENVNNFQCPPGFVKVPGLNSQNITCSLVNDCQIPCDKVFQANEICTYEEPTMDEEEQASCCTSYQYTSGRPKCATGFCSQNTDPNGGCVNAMTSYCTKYGPGNPNCQQFMINTENQKARESILTAYFQNQLQQGNKLTNPLNEAVSALCTQKDLGLGSLCDTLLNKHCKGVDNREQIFENPDFVRLCGCHLDESVYLKSSFDPSGLCDPICNLANTVKNNNQVCKSDVCIFDSDIVNLIINQGKISVNDVCGSGSNRCYFSEEIIQDLEKYQGEINFSSNCQACFSYDPKNTNIDQSVKQIDCIGTQKNPIPTVLLVTGIIVGASIFGFIVFSILKFLL